MNNILLRWSMYLHCRKNWYWNSITHKECEWAEHLCVLQSYNPIKTLTRMHFSRMRTAYCRLLTVFRNIPCISGGMSWGGLPAQPPWIQTPWIQTTPVMWPVMHAGKPPPTVDRRNDTRMWKHFLPTTKVVGGNNRVKIVSQWKNVLNMSSSQR